MDPEACEYQGFQKIWSFDKSIDAANTINVTCEYGYREDGLPDWVWRMDGFEFLKYMPSCYDPTYCEEDVYYVPNAVYNVSTKPTVFTEFFFKRRYVCSFEINFFLQPPEVGTLRYNDGERVVYTCENPGEEENNVSIYASNLAMNTLVLY